jgi:hypothetical protein
MSPSRERLRAAGCRIKSGMTDEWVVQKGRAGVRTTLSSVIPDHDPGSSQRASASWKDSLRRFSRAKDFARLDAGSSPA